jgi:hypothetical protein
LHDKSQNCWRNEAVDGRGTNSPRRVCHHVAPLPKILSSQNRSPFAPPPRKIRPPPPSGRPPSPANAGHPAGAQARQAHPRRGGGHGCGGSQSGTPQAHQAHPRRGGGHGCGGSQSGTPQARQAHPRRGEANWKQCFKQCFKQCLRMARQAHPRRGSGHGCGGLKSGSRRASPQTSKYNKDVEQKEFFPTI